jgi:predicted dehydrogenase
MAQLNRRSFVQTSAACSAALLAGGVVLGADEKKAADKPATESKDKLRLGLIGVGGMGGGNHGGVISEEIVAICDVDEKKLDEGSKKSPKAKRFKDYRKLLDECGKELDGVVISTPDNTHAVAAVQAMKLGLHCYCEKPLAHDVYEARVMRLTAANGKAKGGGKIQTQMGNRGTVESGFRRGVELLQAGVIGPVTDIYIWSNRPIWPQGMSDRPAEEAAPANLDWDLWLGPAAQRPYGKGYHTFAWRGWWDFGTGALGDMACHTANQAYMGLKLGTVKAVESNTKNASKESPPNASTIVYEFAARGEGFPAVKLHWYDGSTAKHGRKEGNMPTGAAVEKIKAAFPKGLPESGVVYVGAKGLMVGIGDYCGQYKLIGEGLDEAAAKVPESLPRFKGSHYQEWIAACKGTIPQAMSNFDYAGMLTEFVLLGNVAMRTGKRIEWDSAALKAAGVAEADQFVKREYRKGWTLDATV